MLRITLASVVVCLCSMLAAGPALAKGNKPPAQQEQKTPAAVPEMAGVTFLEFHVPGAGLTLEWCGKRAEAALDAVGGRERFKKLFYVRQRCTAAWLFMSCAGMLFDEEPSAGKKCGRDGQTEHFAAFQLAMSTKDAACTGPHGDIIPMDGDIYEAVKKTLLAQRKK